ncbi:MAG TPA: hypothetical protein VGO47_00300 [Chlamydiales bacterium]|nr:hypothetical protein [Chlamydiales bacterium]
MQILPKQTNADPTGDLAMRHERRLHPAASENDVTGLTRTFLGSAVNGAGVGPA